MSAPAFFREPPTFSALADQVLSHLVREATAKSPLRIWVPGCSTGEDAYSIAICCLEQFRLAQRQPHLRILATDSEPSSLATARHGVYPEGIVSTIAPEQLQRYFDRKDPAHFQVKDEVRSVLVLAEQNLLTDPSIFSKLDLISWRNMAADLPADAMQRVISRFHFALKDRAWLMLGGGRQEHLPTDRLFELVAPEAALLRKRSVCLGNGLATTGSMLDLVHTKTALEAALQVANGKIATMAEELEIANLNLLLSNAQLKSVNEELGVLNAELRYKVKELNESNDDLTTLLTAIDIAVVFLDGDLRIRRFTASAARLLHLTIEDLGQVLPRRFAVADHGLGEQVQQVIATGAPCEQEIRSESRRCYLRRVLPYLPGGEPPGAVVTWVDITQAKSLQAEVSSIGTLEQQRIGQELHDGILQELTGLGLLAQHLAESLARESGSADHLLAERLARGISEANRHARSLARGLVPVPIDADSLAPALAELARSVQDTFGIVCTFEQGKPIKMGDPGAATHLYRIAQEAVRNATSHARADRISITLRARSGDLVLTVRDNGIGIPLRTQIHPGVGLRLMEHRCSLIGGRFAAEPHRDGGTAISCRVPLANIRLPTQNPPRP